MALATKPGVILGRAVPAETDKLVEIINDAYSVEIGTTTVAFKKPGVLRLRSEGAIKEFQQNVVEGKVLVLRNDDDYGEEVVHQERGEVVACLVYEHRKEEECVFFGPFAVKPESKGRGYGTLLLNELERMAREDFKAKWLKLYVVNHRSELISLYSKKNFVECGTAEYPAPESLTRESHFVIMKKPL